MNRQNARWREWLPWLPVLVWFGVISWFSAQPGEISDAQSQCVENIAQAATVLSIGVRKWAHIALFMVQGALCCNALYAGIGSRRESRQGCAALRAVCIALGICAVLGGMDEAHQLFIAERAAMIEDVGFDVLGGLLGALGYLGIRWLMVHIRPVIRKGNPA